MATLGERIEATYKARDWIVEQVGGPVPGTDLIEVLAGAMTGELDTDMTLEEVQQLVLTVVAQRRAEEGGDENG